MQVAIIGSRKSYGLTAATMVTHIPKNCTRIYRGGATGIERVAREAAQRLNIPITEYLPNYARFGRRAPLVRNIEIIRRADLVLAFWDMASRGSAHAITTCLQRGIPVKVINLKQLK